MALKLKPEYAGVVIGFNNKSLPLGQRSNSDLVSLYERALSRENKKWLSYFEDGSFDKESEDLEKERSFNEKVIQKSAPKIKEARND